MTERVNILGVPVGAWTLDSLLTNLQQFIAGEERGHNALACNAHYANLTYRNKDYLRALQQADIVYADGASLLLAAKILGSPLPERLATWTLWPYLCKQAEKEGWTFYMLGGEEGLAEAGRDKTLESYPALKFVGCHHGYIKNNEREPIESINKARPDVLWVGMGDPFQAIWIEKYRAELDVGLIMGAAGMFKWIADRVDRAPEGWQKAGFEWLYRAMQEPHLIWRYLTGLPAFGIRALLQKFFGHRRNQTQFWRSEEQ